MKLKQLFQSLLAVFLLLSVLPGAVFGAGFGKADLTVTMEFGDIILAGVGVSVCLVADLVDTRNPRYETAAAFAGANPDFEAASDIPKNIALAAILDGYARANNIERITVTTNSQGRAVFSQLDPGIYLISLEDGDYILAPYLLLAPSYNEDDDTWEYNVRVLPKTELKRSPGPSATPESPAPSGSPGPSGTPGPSGSPGPSGPPGTPGPTFSAPARPSATPGPSGPPKTPAPPTRRPIIPPIMGDINLTYLTMLTLGSGLGILIVLYRRRKRQQQQQHV